jgi:hypothetical protein
MRISVNQRATSRGASLNGRRRILNRAPKGAVRKFLFR